MTMLTLRLAFRLLRRDWRAGELRVLVAALVLAVGSVGTVGVLRRSRERCADDAGEPAARRRPHDLRRSSVAGGVRRERAAARARDHAGHPLQQHGAAAGPRAAADASAVLSDVKAVGEGYPLRGAIMLADRGAVRKASVATRHSRSAARRGPTMRLADRLGVKIGDRICGRRIDAHRVARSCSRSPRSPGIVFALGPKLLLNIDDVPATNLLQPGNRATCRLLVADRARRAARSTRTARGSATS